MRTDPPPAHRLRNPGSNRARPRCTLPLVTTSRITSAVLVLACLGLAVAFVVLDPAGPTTEAWKRLALGGGATVAGGLGAVGAGAALLRLIAPDLLQDDRGPLHAMAVGLLLWTLLASGLVLIGHFSTTTALVLPAVLALGWLSRPGLALPHLSPVALLIGLVALVPGLLDALAPPVDTDELYQHLALPARILDTGGLVGGLLAPDGNRPQGLHLVFASLMALGGETAPRLFHLLLTALCLHGTAEVGRAWLGERGTWAALLLVGSYSFVQPAGLAANDIPVALAVLAALDAGLRGRATPLALAAGLALSIKYVAAGALAGVFLASRLPLSRRVLAGLLAIGIVTPWWARNLAADLHPLFPFAGWPLTPLHEGAPGATGLPFQYLEKYGMGRDPKDLLLLPWNAVMKARIETFQFLGRVSPAFLALLPTALLALRQPLPRRLALAALAAALFWAAGPHWLRYLVPGLPLIALALVAGLPEGRLPRIALGLVLLAGLPANGGPLLARAADRLPAAMGREARTTFQARHHPPAALMATLDRRLPDDAVVALLLDWSIYLSPRPVLLGSVEDHVPARAWLLTRGPGALADLKEAGATHLVVGRVAFLEKTYPFLSPEEKARDLDAPLALLEELLLREATLLHQDRSTRLYRLD